jgi:hypothetical protein
MNVHGGIDTPNTSLLGFIPLMDRVSDRNSFFMPGADLVQIRYQCMEIIDTMDIS